MFTGSTKKKLALAAGGAVIAGTLAAGGAAFADDDDDHDKHESSEHDEGYGEPAAELDVETAGRRLHVEAGVEDGQPGQQWRLEIRQNGQQRLTTTRTADEDGEVEVHKMLRNRPGKDTIELIATDEQGQTHTATASAFKRADRSPEPYNGSGKNKSRAS